MELKIKLFILFLVTYISQVKTINLINSDSRYLLLLIFLFYLNLSEVEWFVHTYLMHAENDTFIDKLYKKFVNDDHKQHHRSINTDMTKARELAELAKAVTVVDNQIDVDRTIKASGLLDSSQVLFISTDSAEVTTIADNQALLNALIFGG